MAAAGVDLVPLVEGGGGWLEHDEKLFLQAKEICHGHYGHKTMNQMIDIHRTMPLTRINCVWSDI